MRLHFGLGAETNIQFVEIRWPSGLVEHFRHATVDTVMVATEGTGEPVRAIVGALRQSNREVLEQVP
jgi:hypothetical protein